MSAMLKLLVKSCGEPVSVRAHGSLSALRLGTKTSQWLRWPGGAHEPVVAMALALGASVRSGTLGHPAAGIALVLALGAGAAPYCQQWLPPCEGEEAFHKPPP